MEGETADIGAEERTFPPRERFRATRTDAAASE